VKNFWRKIKKPIIALAPMSGVTDQAFRLMLLKYGRPDVFWTEFIPAEGLFSKGRDYCLETLKFSKRPARRGGGEKPIVAQIFGAKPEFFEKASKEIRDLGFDGVDINMGCPDRNITKTGGGADLIKNPKLAKEIIRAAKRGAGGLPVSVKTRIGYKKNEIEKWIVAILKENVSALTVHFRTKEQMYLPKANWELAKEIVRLKDIYCPETIIIGNGDIEFLEQAKKMAAETGVDGVMIGRGALANPWIFSGKTPTTKEKLKAILEHAKISEKLGCKNFDSIKKYFHSYAKGFVGARELRDGLMRAKSLLETKKIVSKFLNQLEKES